MCSPEQVSGPAEALAVVEAMLVYLNDSDMSSLPATTQAALLKGLERVEARHTAARARLLAAFSAGRIHEDDGQRSARTWLRWQTRVTASAAMGAVGWMRRLAAHPVIGQALAEGQISPSWARHLCAWSNHLPAQARHTADEILAAAAAGGADLEDLAVLAEQIYQRTAHEGRADTGPAGDGAAGDGTAGDGTAGDGTAGDGARSRASGGDTCGGHGADSDQPSHDSPDADGSNDRDRDGFDDRYLRLGITLQGAGRVEGDLTPGCAAALSAVLEALGKKAGAEDTRTIAQRRHDALEEACRRLIASGMLPGRAGQPTQVQVHMSLDQLRTLPGAARAENAWAAARATQPGWLTGPAAEAAACDATIVPIVTGHVDWGALDRIGTPPSGRPGALLTLAAEALSGPTGLAARLRAGLGSTTLSSVSLPLDIGAATESIPAHLRRAVSVRHPRCAFPGCDEPASVCDVHHLIPRSHGGATALRNLVPLCTFHHQVVIHRWGWALRLNVDGTTTATAPDGRVLHSHGPPGEAA